MNDTFFLKNFVARESTPARFIHQSQHFAAKIKNDEVIRSIGRKWSASPKRATLQ
jgi:hypothetical protein